jgi:PTH1 family peptidyl-tRNA hydrolase
MNESGKSVGALVRFYKIPLSQLLVAYDDIDLPLGAIRLRSSGGTGGHKGMQSIINVLGTNAFARLRLGIGRPPGQKQAADYVLKDFAPHEQEPLTFMLNRGVAAVRTFLLYGIEAAMNEFNTTANQAE